MFDVTTLGEVLIDFTEAGTSDGGMSLFERNAGGAPANVLVALQRLGHPTAFIGKVGADMHGEFLRRTLEGEGVDCSGLVSDPAFFTTLAFVALAPSGERTFSFARKPGADTRIAPDELPRDVIASSRVFHVGSLSLTDEPARSATRSAISLAREAGCTLSYDPNYRAEPVALARGRGRADALRDRRYGPHEDLGRGVRAAHGRRRPRRRRPRAGRRGREGRGGDPRGVGRLRALRRGRPDGARFPRRGRGHHGCGRLVLGGFLAAFCESGLPADAVTLDDAERFARMGNAVASLCVRGRGGIPSMPGRAAVEALLP